MLTEIIVIILTIAAGFYWWLLNRNKYWVKRNVITRPPLLFYGNLKDRVLFKTPFHIFYRQFYEDFKGHKYVGVYEGRIPSLMIRDPDLIKNILSKDFDHFVDRSTSRFKKNPQIEFMLIFITGNQWKKLRAAVTPTFTSGKMKGLFSTVEDNAIKMIEHLKAQTEKNSDQILESVDTKDLFGKVALDIIASTAFGVQCNSFSVDGKTEFARKIGEFNNLSIPTRMFLLSLLFLDLPGWITKHITLSFFNKKTVDFLAQVYKDTAKYRTDNNMRRNDFLQLLLDAQKGALEEEGAVERIHKEGALINEDVAIAQSVLFFIAGYETSSSLLSMASYCLAQEKEVQDKLRNEITNVMGDDQNLTYEKINEMQYLDMVLSETLRLYPPVARLDRVCSKPYKIDHIDLPVGHRVFIPCAGIHMDPDYYPEPEKFIPERFSAEEKAKRHPYVYMPFGLGPRNCIGMRFAQMSTKIVMAHLVKNFIIEVDSETPLPFKYDERSMLLKPKGGVLKVKLRSASY
ncbi:Cytochrome P450 [Nesidiocoris tenuis]|uniref:Cytochrome P450 n=1 Tax=Nesidiocoris tenuis TaxID=355587 RepID=A0ABN7AYL9_9HEMI|nr:Cytochrome P450 [Nesidiocoris tenuis]